MASGTIGRIEAIERGLKREEEKVEGQRKEEESKKNIWTQE